MSTASAISNPITICMSILRDEEASNVSLKNAFDAFINSLSGGIQSKNINNISEELKEMTFELRLDLIIWLAEENISTEKYFDIINEELTEIDHSESHIILHETVRKTLNSFQKIVASIYAKEGVGGFDEAQDVIQNDRLNYNVFRFLESHPHPQFKYLKKWIDESLKFDIALTIAILVIEKEINLNQKRIQHELIPFLNKTIDQYGAYSIFTEFWKPDKDDFSPETYKMQILADTIRMNNSMQPLFLENEEDLEDVGLRLVMKESADVKEYVDTETFLHQLRKFVAEEGGSGKIIYGNWNNIQETLLVLEHKTLPDTIQQSREDRKNNSVTKTIEEIFADV